MGSHSLSLKEAINGFSLFFSVTYFIRAREEEWAERGISLFLWEI